MNSDNPNFGKDWRIFPGHGTFKCLIKQAPGWRIAHRCTTLQEAAVWLEPQGADLTLVPVVEDYPFKSLQERLTGG